MFRLELNHVSKRGPTGLQSAVDIPHKGSIMRNFGVFFVVKLNNATRVASDLRRLNANLASLLQLSAIQYFIRTHTQAHTCAYIHTTLNVV